MKKMIPLALLVTAFQTQGAFGLGKCTKLTGESLSEMAPLEKIVTPINDTGLEPDAICTIRYDSSHLNWQQTIPPFTELNVTAFIDNATSDNGYVILKGRKGVKRMFAVNREAVSQLLEKASAIPTARTATEQSVKNDVFECIEERLIKASDDLDAQTK